MYLCVYLWVYKCYGDVVMGMCGIRVCAGELLLLGRVLLVGGFLIRVVCAGAWSEPAELVIVTCRLSDGCIFEGVTDNIESFIGDMDNEKEGGKQMEAVKRGVTGDFGVIGSTVVCIVVVVRSGFTSELSSLLLKTRSFAIVH